MALIANTIENDPKYGKLYDGFVVSTADELHSGRIQVKVPELLGDTPVWAQSVQPTFESSQTQGLHIQAIPPAGQTVKVKFSGNDNDCIWFGGSPKPGTVEDPDILLIRDKQGNSVKWFRKTGEIQVNAIGPVSVTSKLKIVLNAPTIELNGKVSMANGTSGAITPITPALVSGGVVTQIGTI